MNRSRLAVAVALAVIGIIWVGQGLGYIGGSFMTRQPLWAVIGGVLLVVAVALAVSARSGSGTGAK